MKNNNHSTTQNSVWNEPENIGLGLFAGAAVAVASATAGGAAGMAIDIAIVFGNAVESPGSYASQFSTAATIIASGFMGGSNLTEIRDISPKQRAFSSGAVISSATALGIVGYNLL